MKRAFLFGLGSFLILGVLAGLIEAFRPGPVSTVVGAVMIAACAPLSLWAIRSAQGAPPNRSTALAIGGWALGFMAVNAGILAASAIVMLVN